MAQHDELKEERKGQCMVSGQPRAGILEEGTSPLCCLSVPHTVTSWLTGTLGD